MGQKYKHKSKRYTYRIVTVINGGFGIQIGDLEGKYWSDSKIPYKTIEEARNEIKRQIEIDNFEPQVVE